MLPSAPVLCAGIPTHQQLYEELHEAVSAARRVTVVCGAGVSTSAGIPVRFYQLYDDRS